MDAQVQSIFHELKRCHADTAAPNPRQYRDSVQQRITRVRHDDHLPDHVRHELIRQLESAERTPPPDGGTWYAVDNVAAQSEIAAERFRRLFTEAAAQLRVSPERVRRAFTSWLHADAHSFEQVASPDPRFAHNPEKLGLPTDRHTLRALRKLGYEQFLGQRYPVFVYGTLRQGQGNSGLMEPAVTHVSSAQVSGVAIYGSNYGFPYAAEHPDPQAVTVGELVDLADNWEGDQARHRLDQLEGFDSDFPSQSHYERRLVNVQLSTPERGAYTTPAWIYLARGLSQQNLHERDRILDGDWVLHRGY